MKKQAGFTLIELVIVIIILGILAVTAAPKFLNLQDDARKSAAQGVQAALQSASALVYSKAVLNGYETSAGPISMAAPIDKVAVAYGYPTAATISEAVALDGLKVSGAVAANTITFAPSGKGDSCSVTYKEVTVSNGTPTISLVGCK